MKKRINIVIATLLVLLAGCRSAKKETMVTSDMQKIEMNSGVITPQLTGGNPASTSPMVYIYKTKVDYSHQVPVMQQVHLLRQKIRTIWNLLLTVSG